MTIYDYIYTVLEFVFGDMITTSAVIGGLCEIFSAVFCFGAVFAIFITPLCLIFGIFKRRGKKDEN